MRTISIVIPTYNRADILPRALESVLSQTVSDFEVIVVDDGSTDNTEAVVNSYDDPRLRYVRSEERKGANAARNAGIDAAEADIVSFLDSDDTFHPQHLEVAMNRLNNAPSSCGGVFTAFKKVRDGETVTISDAPAEFITQDQLITENVVGGFSTVTLRSEVFETVGRLDEEMPSAQDIEFFIRVLEEYSLLGIDRPLMTYYYDADRISDDIERKIAGQERLMEKHGHKLSRAGQSRIYSSRAFVYARNDEVTAARRNFLRAIRADPTSYLSYYHYFASLLGRRVFDVAVHLKQRVKSGIHRIQNG
jgi:glycosyltransferase involved in cell wall biosynthesis